MKKLIIITLIAAIIIAFLAGRASVKQTHKTIYTKGKEIKSNAQISLPIKEIQPIAPVLPYKYIFINNTKTEVVDTAKIINNYMAQRTYSLTLFDNLHGKLHITPTLQYNKLTAVPFTFTPIEKTIYKQNRLTLFSTASYNTFNIVGVGAGFYYNNFGLHYKHLWNNHLKTRGHEVGINIMF